MTETKTIRKQTIQIFKDCIKKYKKNINLKILNKLSKDIETSIYNYTIDFSEKKGIRINWDNIIFKKTYS